MNYKVYYDGSYTYLSGTDDEPNGYDVFESFSEAKKHAIYDIKESIESLKLGLKRVKEQRKSEMEID